MTSIRHRIGGYLKQIVGEVVGSQSLHETGKREILGLPEDGRTEAIVASVSDQSLETGSPVYPVSSAPVADAQPSSCRSDHPHQQKERKMSVYTQMLPKIEQDHEAFVKVASENHVLYVPISNGATFQDARAAVIEMAKRLTAEPEKATAPSDAESGSEEPGGRAETNEDLDDQLDIGLADSFPASDPPAAAASTVLPKRHGP